MREGDGGQHWPSVIDIGVIFGVLIGVVLEPALGAGRDAFAFAGGAIGAFFGVLYGGARVQECFIASATAVLVGLVVQLGGMVGSGLDQDYGWRMGSTSGVLLSVGVARVVEWIRRHRSGTERSSYRAS